jgi:hypothetical protein
MGTFDLVMAVANPSLNTVNIIVPIEIMNLAHLEGKLKGEGASPLPSLSMHEFLMSALAMVWLWRGGRGGDDAGLVFHPCCPSGFW